MGKMFSVPQWDFLIHCCEQLLGKTGSKAEWRHCTLVLIADSWRFHISSGGVFATTAVLVLQKKAVTV